MAPRKTQSHGRIGEAAVAAKCWMHGIPAYNTAGLRANFAGSDIIVDTKDPRRKLLVQVKTGSTTTPGHVYFTQCKGEEDLQGEKFVADFVVFVNIDPQVAKAHDHDGQLRFGPLSFYVLPRDEANALYHAEVWKGYRRPKRDGGQRKLTNMGVSVVAASVEQYRDAWHLIREFDAESPVEDADADAVSLLSPGLQPALGAD